MQLRPRLSPKLGGSGRTFICLRKTGAGLVCLHEKRRQTPIQPKPVWTEQSSDEHPSNFAQTVTEIDSLRKTTESGVTPHALQSSGSETDPTQRRPS
ncbi:hypothetical protein V502_03781 [Pseudogymnoascus sp. VKM F-4520 (FW-2644)]|nr:hypothetical protein V502_03781 [Pseudogymnoascus sp. VKM F-4520 (FW-2644)]